MKKIKAFSIAELMVAIAIFTLLILLLALTFPTITFIINRTENRYKAIVLADKLLQNLKKYNLNREDILKNKAAFEDMLNKLFSENKATFKISSSSTKDNIIITSDNIKSNKTTYKLNLYIKKYKSSNDPYLNDIQVELIWRNIKSKKDTKFKIETILYTLH